MLALCFLYFQGAAPRYNFALCVSYFLGAQHPDKKKVYLPTAHRMTDSRTSISHMGDMAQMSRRRPNRMHKFTTTDQPYNKLKKRKEEQIGFEERETGEMVLSSSTSVIISIRNSLFLLFLQVLRLHVYCDFTTPICTVPLLAAGETGTPPATQLSYSCRRHRCGHRGGSTGRWSPAASPAAATWASSRRPPASWAASTAGPRTGPGPG